jgi:hypothetical protein
LGVAFKVQQTADENPYDPAFVKKILKRAESARKGNTVELNNVTDYKSALAGQQIIIYQDLLAPRYRTVIVRHEAIPHKQTATSCVLAVTHALSLRARHECGNLFVLTPSWQPVTKMQFEVNYEAIPRLSAQFVSLRVSHKNEQKTLNETHSKKATIVDKTNILLF